MSIIKVILFIVNSLLRHWSAMRTVPLLVALSIALLTPSNLQLSSHPSWTSTNNVYQALGGLQ